MSIKIEITDPHLMSPELLIKTASYLLSLKGIPLSPSPIVSAVPVAISPVTEVTVNTSSEGWNVKVNQPAQQQVPLYDKEPEVIVEIGELDTVGQSWDSKIHSRTKSKTTKGVWKVKRGFETEEEPKSIPVPSYEPEEKEPDFSDLMILITDNIPKKKINSLDVTKIVQEFGIPSVAVAATRPDLVPAIYKKVQEHIA